MYISLLTLPSLLGCGQLIETQPPSFPTAAEVCLPDATSWTATGASPDRAGTSTALVTFGTSHADQNQFRFAAVGAPGFDSDDTHTGSVLLTWASVSDGRLDGSSAYNQTLSPPPFRLGLSFGQSVLNADVTDCRRGAYVGAPELGCGEEIMVGSPDLPGNSEGGAVHLYESDGTPATNTLFTYVTTLADPAASLSGEFGYSLAHTPTTIPSNFKQPWIVAPEHPMWVAVGAPGDDRVEIFQVDPLSFDLYGNPTPFHHVQTISSPWVGINFGYAISVADFNGDLLPDLAVGAPDYPSGGAVYVYKGLLSGPPLASTGLEVLGSPLPSHSHPNDQFGFSLSAGNTFGGEIRDTLIVGAPGYGTSVGLPDEGGVCQALFENSASNSSGLSTSTLDCWANPDAVAGERFGHAVAVGDFGAVDGNGSIYTDAAVLRDTAISRPGYNSGDGAVTIYFSDDQGTDLTAELAQITDPSGVSATSFGSSLSAGYVQETTWSDLLIGAPSANTHEGLAALTVAGDMSSVSCDLVGYWTISFEKADLSTTTDATMMIWLDSAGAPVLNFAEGLRLNLVDDSSGTDALCEDEIIDPEEPFGDKISMRSSFWVEPGVTFPLNATCASAATSSTSWEWTGVPFGSVVASFLTPAQWNFLSPSTQINVLNTTADISATVVSTNPREIELYVDVDWESLWATLPGSFPDDCIKHRGTPYDAVQTREDICED